MGNCLKCFRSSDYSNSTGAVSATTHNYICQSASNENAARTGVTIVLSSVSSNSNNANHVAHETDELLSPRIQLKANNCDTKRSSFKKSIFLLNGNSSSNTRSETNTPPVKETISDNTLNMLFEKYKDPEEDLILSEGIESFCRDLNYQPDEFAILVLAWCLDASQMCRFTKSEFIEGLHKMSADSIEKIRKRLEQTIQMLKKDAEMFKQLYRFTFRFGLEPDQRILSLDMAISLWKLVFTVHTPEILENWLNFLQQDQSIRGIPKDTWNMFLNFSEQCDIYNYDDTEAWPSLFDDFVDYEKLRLGAAAQDADNNNDDVTQAHIKSAIAAQSNQRDAL